MEDDEVDFECDCEDCISQKPTQPLASDCCGSGCQPCVNDLYDADIKAWKKACFGRHHDTQVDHKGPETKVIETNSFKSFPLEDIKCESSDTWCYKFSIPDRGSLNLDVGQHLVLRAQVEGRFITRQYTPLYNDGIMSKYIREWKVGDMVEWRGPYSSYQYQQNKYTHLVMLAAGTGIAPMLQVIRHIVHNEEEDTFVRLLYCCRTYKDLLLRAEINQLTAFWNFTALYILSKEDESNCHGAFGEDHYFGRLDETLVAKELPPNTSKCQALICGNKSFDKDMIKYLRKLDFQGDIFKF
ncbi:LOW QUALITY PROTEIN: NADH-cytochrome b5 reductase-like [Amphiura filiformis]|uniref:LOW QUALITY PROTEIN: NADH-cytochrome b5 reductase-like n=1 Tax=Amphiura filiformis TaxID=82378 RepID=UPI003B215AEB